MELILTQDELWLLDWVLCYPMQQAAPQVEWHMTWATLRDDLWKAIIYLNEVAKEGETPTEAMVWIETSDLRVLLALTPTTFRWGTGQDCGHSLKMKIAKALLAKGEP